MGISWRSFAALLCGRFCGKCQNFACSFSLKCNRYGIAKCTSIFLFAGIFGGNSMTQCSHSGMRKFYENTMTEYACSFPFMGWKCQGRLFI